MSESKHTPGPWVVDPEYPSEVQTGKLLTVASCWHAHVEGLTVNLIGVLPCSLEESAANARLIAAAPAMFEALKAAMAFIDSHAADPDITAEMMVNWERLQATNPHAVLSAATSSDEVRS